MTTPEQIIAKIEEIEKMMEPDGKSGESLRQFHLMLMELNAFKSKVLNYYNLPTADPPEGSPGQEDMEG